MSEPRQVQPLGYAASESTNRVRRKLRFALASLVLGLAPLLLLGLLMAYAHVHWSTYPVERMFERMWRPYHVSAIGVALQAVGAAVAVAAVVRNEVPSWVPVAVFTLNAL